MKTGIRLLILAILIAHTGNTFAATKEEPAPLTRAGQELEKQYSQQLEALREEIKNAVPKIDAENQAAYASARETEAEAEKELKTVQDASDAAKTDEPALNKQLEAAQQALEAAKENTATALKACNVVRIVESDKLDDLLMKFAVLSEATPHGLAAFAQQGAEHAKLVEVLLQNGHLMGQMVTAGGAQGGKYGEAMKIYVDIQKASNRAVEPGILHRLALGTSLEMVVPYSQKYGTYLSSDTGPIDPVERYLHYEKAYLAGDLAPEFEGMSAWECRWIVDEPASNEELAWLRRMLRNYRPDLVGYEEDLRWYYSLFIKTDVTYTRPKWDPSLPVSHLQEAVDKGGICHIRGWIARSLARSFGIPALRVEQGSGDN